MKKSTNKKIILFIIILLILLIGIICLLCFFQNKINKKENNVDQENVIQPVETKKITVKDIIEKYGSKYIKIEKYDIYIDSKKDLYDENGNSNQEYFEKLVEELCNVEELNKRSFALIDENKNMRIQVKYNSRFDKYEITYNQIDDFYENVDGEAYSKVDSAKIIEKTSLKPSSKELYDLIEGGLFFKSVKNSIGEGKEYINGYTSFKDGSILMKIQEYRVKTIIFTKDYKDDVFIGIKVGMNLKDIQEMYSDNLSGSVSDGYLMYRTSDVYAFFYEDEIVVYGYNYYENEPLENDIEEYLSERNLESFVNNITKKWINYDKNEYNPDTQSAYITYPSRGIEINIKNNDPIGIKLYKNYYFTEKTKNMIKSGQISLDADDDFLEITEKERRKNF